MNNANNNVSNIISNYDITLKRCSEEFVKLDLCSIAKRFNLTIDSNYLYINMLNIPFRINLSTGYTEYSFKDNFEITYPASFNSALTIFDILGESKDNAVLSGNYTSIGHVKGYCAANAPSYDFFDKSFQFLEKNFDSLPKAFNYMGGIEFKGADLSYSIPLFDFFIFKIQIWRADDEFPVSVNILWDENLFDFLKFETTYYALSHFFELTKYLCSNNI